MTRFGRRAHSTRYLWTDALAVCNYLSLGETDLAVRLVHQVHHTLGKHRPDDRRTGWLSGLAEGFGDGRPTAGGLRIGKELQERAPGAPIDEQIEWERDGQYFHYLTKWMHALDRVANATRSPLYARWSRDLADIAFRRFVHGSRMYWKMSIDLSRPLVGAMGLHDPFDGYVTYRQLQATSGTHDLDAAIASFATMIEPDLLATSDPLGIGGLLFHAQRLAALGDTDHLELALVSALSGLRVYISECDLRAPVDQRIAFRELGLVIGLHAAATIQPPNEDTRYLLNELATLDGLCMELESFWLDPQNRARPGWRAHLDINEVMLATCLAPGGFLLSPRSGAAFDPARNGRALGLPRLPAHGML
ncbi:MAG: hypothetical protein HOV81_15645 [Kofleriaceae bacterium]|nr:hypothetical protein [Kofleriaceae bacterium]